MNISSHATPRLPIRMNPKTGHALSGRRRTTVLAAGMASVLALLVTSCGDDGQTAEDGAGPAASDVGESGDASGFCTGYQELLAGEPAPDQIRSLAAAAPEEAARALDAIATGMEEDGEDFFGSPAFNESFEALGASAADECADDEIEVTATDYAFAGLPEEMSPGTVAVTFANDGSEFHEMIVLRKNDDTGESFDEILAMTDEDAAQALVSEAGAIFAEPGATATALFNIEEPGDYIAVCFIPQGSTPEGEATASGAPHFTYGMMTEFSVG